MSTQYTELQLDALRELANIGSGTARDRALEHARPAGRHLRARTRARCRSPTRSTPSGPAESRDHRRRAADRRRARRASCCCSFPPADAGPLCRCSASSPTRARPLRARRDRQHPRHLLHQRAGGDDRPRARADAARDRDRHARRDRRDACSPATRAPDDLALLLDSELLVEGEACSLSFLLVPTPAASASCSQRLGLGVMTGSRRMVRMGELAVVEAPATCSSRSAWARASASRCVDRRAGIAGLAHVMLPEAPDGAPANPRKFADLAVPALIDRAARRSALGRAPGGGAGRRRADVRRLGGERSTSAPRNEAAVRDALAALRIPVPRPRPAARAGARCASTSRPRPSPCREAGGKDAELLAGTRVLETGDGMTRGDRSSRAEQIAALVEPPAKAGCPRSRRRRSRRRGACARSTSRARRSSRPTRSAASSARSRPSAAPRPRGCRPSCACRSSSRCINTTQLTWSNAHGQVPRRLDLRRSSRPSRSARDMLLSAELERWCSA